MAAATARLLLETSVGNVTRLRTKRKRGGVYGNPTPEQLDLFLHELQGATQEFMDAVLRVAESGLDDLYRVNSSETIQKHLDAFNLCEAVNQHKQGLFDLEHAMKYSAVSAEYTELVEFRPLMVIREDRDVPFSLVVQPLPVLVSGVRFNQDEEEQRPKRRARPTQETQKRQRTAPQGVRRSARLAALQAPQGNPPDTHPPLMRGLQLSETELEQETTRAVKKSRQRMRARRTPQEPWSIAQETREAVTSLQTLEEGSWLSWLTEELQDPSTTILDLVATVSSALARDFSVPVGALGSFMAHKFLSSFVNKRRRRQGVQEEEEPQKLSTTLTAIRSISSASIGQNFTRLANGSLQQLAAVATGSIVEIVYNCVTLTTPTLIQPLPEQERSTWLRFLYKWSPLLALALALALVTVRQDVIAWLITPNVLDISGGSLELAASTPGALVTSVATSYLPENHVAVQLLEQFYDFAAEGINALQRKPLSVPLRRSVLELVSQYTSFTTYSTTVNWMWSYYDFLSRLHRLQFVAPMLHVFSLVEHGANMLARSWRWVASQLKRWVGEDNPVRDIIDWVTELADFVVLMIRFFAQLSRYHSLMLLLLAVLQALLHYGVEGTSTILQRPLLFGGLL